jgi:predicted RNA-binding Zn-ribbon protein involved in translation (DUF1610 family)
MSGVTKDAERVRRPKLPKRRLLRRQRKRFNHAHDGGQEIKPKRTGYKRGMLFCPQCGSTNLFWASGLPHLWSIWECKNCGYRGAFIVRDGKLAEKVRENYAKKTAKE